MYLKFEHVGVTMYNMEVKGQLLSVTFRNAIHLILSLAWSSPICIDWLVSPRDFPLLALQVCVTMPWFFDMGFWAQTCVFLLAGQRHLLNHLPGPWSPGWPHTYHVAVHESVHLVPLSLHAGIPGNSTTPKCMQFYAPNPVSGAFL